MLVITGFIKLFLNNLQLLLVGIQNNQDTRLVCCYFPVDPLAHDPIDSHRCLLMDIACGYIAPKVFVLYYLDHFMLAYTLKQPL